MKHIYILLFIFYALGAFAQTTINPVAQNYIKKGEEEFRNGNYEAAAINFKAAVTNLKDSNVPLRDYAPYEKREEDANQLASLKKNADNWFASAKTIADFENARKRYTEITAKNSADNHAKRRISECNTRIGQIRENDAWNVAVRANTIDAYKKYLGQFPEGPHKNDALKKIDEHTLAQQKETENALWNSALNTNTMAAFEDYLSKYPEGLYKNAALTRINEIKLAMQNEQDDRLWKIATELDTPEGYFTYITETDNGKYISTARTKIVELQDLALWEEAKRINTVDSYTYYLENDNNSVKKFAGETTALIEEIYAREAFEDGDFELAIAHLSNIRKTQRFTDAQQQLLDKCHEENDYASFMKSPSIPYGKIFLEKYPDSKYRADVQKKYDGLVRATSGRGGSQPGGRSDPPPPRRNTDRVSLILAGHFEFLDCQAYGLTTGMKIGSFESPVNMTVEAGYRHTTPGENAHKVKIDGITLNQGIGAAMLKFNLGGNHLNDKFVFGFGGEYNYTFSSFYQLDNAYTKVNDINIRNDHSVSGVALLGWGFHNGAVNLYYRYSIMSPYNSQYIKENLGDYEYLMNQVDNKSRIGFSVVIYIHK